MVKRGPRNPASTICRCDQKLATLQRQKIAAAADDVDVPGGVRGGRVGGYTELSLLEHNFELQRPRIAIRQLLNRARTAITALKPCFMMKCPWHSTSSRGIEFDLIIMDDLSNPS